MAGQDGEERRDVMDLREIKNRAELTIDVVQKARGEAIRYGAAPNVASAIGEEAEACARDCLALLDLLDEARSEVRDRPRVVELVAELYALTRPAERVDLAPDTYAVSAPAPAVEVHVDEDIGDTDEPIKAAPVLVEDDGKQTTTPALGGNPALSVAEKRRAPEKQKPIATWELSGADFRALPYDRPWVESQIGEFREEHASDLAARPRVVLAAWLGKRPDAEAHRRAAE